MFEFIKKAIHKMVPNKFYVGMREKRKANSVVVNFKYNLDPRNDLVNHSPDGFEWGYCGSGPSQLSLAILADHLQDDERAKRMYRQFTWKVVSNWKENTWKITSKEIDKIVEEIEKEYDN